jgi:hypothetical protein
MSDHQKRDQWLQDQDIEARQRNVVFPDTVQKMLSNLNSQKTLPCQSQLT